jgi:transposase InsO family protein
LGLTRDRVLPILGLSRHQYYYKPKGTRPGNKPTKITRRLVDNKVVEESNEQVVEQIKQVKSDPDTDYGYRKMCVALMILGYYINHKKVYRIMKEQQLLRARYKRRSKNYAQYRTVIPEGPLQVLEMDIKYVWVARHRRNAFVLTIIDTFTRFVLHWQVGFTMKSNHVKKAWEEVILNYLQPADLLNKKICIEIRNDNGPQFGSKMIQAFFKENYINQVFTHPYTPQENGHIESFHNILSASLSNQEFWDLEELIAKLTIFYEKYNNTRLHGSIANLPPKLFWELWDKNMITREVKNHGKVKFSLKCNYQQLSGNASLREVPCLNPTGLDARLDLQKKVPESENEPKALLQPSVQRSPSVVPC